MIIGLWHPGSGLGDQLFCYLAARITSERLKVPFTMVGKFKGDSFMTLNHGIVNDVPHHIENPAGKIIIENDWPVYEGKTYYDPEFNFIEDNTIVDGCRIQDERYWEKYPIKTWLKTEPLEIDDALCVIGFRGGEYYTDPNLGLPKEYYYDAMRYFPHSRFQVHTDDKILAKSFFPDFEIIQDMEINWRSMRYAKNAIVANSAFYILPRLLRAGTTIAPRYWARRNLEEWSTPQNYYTPLKYI